MELWVRLGGADTDKSFFREEAEDSMLGYREGSMAVSFLVSSVSSGFQWLVPNRKDSFQGAYSDGGTSKSMRRPYIKGWWLAF